MDIHPGSRVRVTTARNERIEMVARSGITFGRDVQIVWVSDVDDYTKNGDDAHQLPWPAAALEASQTA